MNGAQQDHDPAPVEFEPRSLYWACSACGSMVTDADRERHRRHHATLSRALDEAATRGR